MRENNYLEWLDSLQETIPTKLYNSISDTALDDLIGESIPPYRIESLHAVGGFSAIYTAERTDKLLARKFAVKISLPEFSSLLKGVDIKKELNKISKLNHSNIAHVYDAGRLNNQDTYIVMEFVDGKDIVTHTLETNASLHDKINLIRQLCKALQFAHEQNVIHNDLKPSNVLIDHNGQLKLLDFGIATLEFDTEESQYYVNAMSLPYTSPEHLEREPVTRRSDIYSCGMLLAATLLGIQLSPTTTPVCAVQKLTKAFPGDLVSIVKKCLNMTPLDRYHSVDMLLDDLTRFQNNQPVNAHPPKLPYLLSKLFRQFPVFSSVSISLFLFAALFAGSLFVTLDKVKREKATAQAFSSILKNIIALSDPWDEFGLASTGERLITAVIRQIESDDKLSSTSKLVLKSQVLMSQIQNDEFNKATAMAETIENEFETFRSLLSAGEQQFIAVTLAYSFNHVGKQQKADGYISIARENETSEYPATPIYVVDYIEAYSLSNQSKNHETIELIKHSIKSHDSIKDKYLADMHYLASVSYRELAMTEQAIESIKIAIDRIVNHPTADKVLPYYHSSLARALVDIEEYDQAKDYFDKALTLSKQTNGENSEAHMVIMNDAASLYLNTQQYEQSLTLYQQVNQWIVSNYGSENSNAATMALNICLSYQGLNNIKRAVEYCSLAETTFSNIQVDHLYRLKSLLALAELSIFDKDTAQARVLLTELSKFQTSMSKGFMESYEKLKNKIQ